MEDHKPMASELRRHRIERGWSQQNLADLLAVSQATVANWEAHNNWPSPRYRLGLERCFAMRLEALMGQTQDEWRAQRTNGSANGKTHATSSDAGLTVMSRLEDQNDCANT